MKKITALSLACLLLAFSLAGCQRPSPNTDATTGTAQLTTAPTETPDPEPTPTAQPTDAPAATATEAPAETSPPPTQEDMDNFLELVSDEFSVEGAQKAWAALEANSAKYVLPDSMVTAYIKYMETAALTVTDENKEELLSLGFTTYMSEGDTYPRVDMLALQSKLAGKISEGMEAFMKLTEKTESTRIAEDAGIVVEWKELGDFAAEWKALEDQYPEIDVSLGWNSMRLTEIFVGRFVMDNTPVVEKGVLQQQYRDEMKAFAANHPESALSPVIGQAYEVWEKAGFKQSEAVDSQLDKLLAPLNRNPGEV